MKDRGPPWSILGAPIPGSCQDLRIKERTAIEEVEVQRFLIGVGGALGLVVSSAGSGL